MKKIITAFLAALMLFSVMACANNSGKKNNNGNGTTTVEGKIWDKKEFDFGGEPFIILGKEIEGNIIGWGGDDLNCEELTGNEVLDEVYHRNRLIESTYNCDIKYVYANDIKTTLLSASEEDGHLISNKIKVSVGLVEEDLVLNLRDPSFTHLDLDQDWYSQTVQRDNKIAGNLYFVNGDMLFTDENAMWVTLYNKELASRYMADLNLYEEVKAGRWTIDMLMKYAALATEEIIADDNMDYNDQWGYIGEGPNVAALVIGAGHRFAKITDDGGIVSGIYHEDFLSTFSKCYETVDKRFCQLATDIKGVDDAYATNDACFTEGRALFMITAMSRVLAFREMDTDFGVLPVPKFTVEQENYYTWTTNNTNVVSVPYTCSNPEKTSAIMEALFEESSYALRPAYVDKALKYQSTRDDESIEMLDIIMDGTVYDIGIYYDFGGIFTQLNLMVRNRSMSSLYSTVQKYETPVNNAINDLLDRFGYNSGS